MMDPALQAAVDRSEIRQVLARYARGIDRRDRALLETVYWPDARDDHGAFVGPASEYIDWVLDALRQLKGTTHFLGQSAIEFDGMRAGVETYLVAYHIKPTDEGARMDVMGGRYIDLFEKRDGEWRVLDRKVMYDWNDGRAMAPYMDPAAFKGSSAAHGSPSRADPSFSVLTRSE